MKINRTYCLIFFLSLFGCNEAQYNYNCGVAPSTPTDLTITNDTNQELKVVLKVKKEELINIKSIKLFPDERVSFCIEYEGAITDGIYVEFNNQITIIKLTPQQPNEFTLKERRIEKRYTN